MEMEVEKMSDSEIVSCNFDEWANYLATKYSVIPISILKRILNGGLLKQKLKEQILFVVLLMKEITLR